MLVLLQQRDGESGPYAGLHGSDGRRIAFGIGLIDGQIGNVDKRFGGQHAATG